MVAGGRSAVAWTVLALFTVLGGSSADDPPVAPRVWTVFCAECTNNFDYKCVSAAPLAALMKRGPHECRTVTSHSPWFA
eukprot:scaffold24714_cov106-Isochrysis_galbana.AAC.1